MGLPRLTKTSSLALSALGSCAALFVACATAPTERAGFEDTDGGSSAVLPDGAPAVLPDGAPAVLPDGAKPQGDGSVTTLPDGAVAPTNRVACGGTFCRADQACNMGRCEFACTGTQVPGDYATLANAVSALSPNGGTICLKAQTYSESVSVTGTAGKTLTIVGVNANDTKVTGITVGTGFDAVTIRGIGSQITAQGRSKLEAIAVAGMVYVQANGPQETRIEGANLGGTPTALQSYGLYIYPQSGGGSPKVTVQNTYFHDNTRGIYMYGNYGVADVSVLNCTFANNTDGIVAVSSTYPPVLTYSNNIFVNQRSFALNLAGPIPQLVHENNLLFGNANNYSGIAADGADYLKADPNLDNAVPPEPRTGSPARKSSLTSRAPATDFYGVARAGGADRGAVQGL